MKNIRNYPEFTHFACLPFRQPQQRQNISQLQEQIKTTLHQHYPKEAFDESNFKHAHVTISMLVLHREDTKKKFIDIFTEIQEQLAKILNNTLLTFSQVKYFTRLNPKTKKKEVTLIYLEIDKDSEWAKLTKAADLFFRAMLKTEIIANTELKQMRVSYNHNENLYQNEQYHLTLFRVKDVVQDEKFQTIFKQLSNSFKTMAFQCHTLDISTRTNYEEGGFYLPFQQIELAQKQ